MEVTYPLKRSLNITPKRSTFSQNCQVDHIRISCNMIPTYIYIFFVRFNQHTSPTWSSEMSGLPPWFSLNEFHSTVAWLSVLASRFIIKIRYDVMIWYVRDMLEICYDMMNWYVMIWCDMIHQMMVKRCKEHIVLKWWCWWDCWHWFDLGLRTDYLLQVHILWL